jgi:COP9 signalosome complex subunit 5
VNKLADDKPWDSQPDYFTNCKISVNALTKMLIHACLGSIKWCATLETNEVMGILQGRIEKQTFIIFDVIQIHA